MDTKLKNKIVSELLQNHNPIDVVTLDIPLFIRLLEYAKEDAKDDMDLHELADKTISISTDNKVLTMSDYEFLIS